MPQKFAIVTGASSGIGGDIALELAKSDYIIALVGRNQERLTQIKTKVDAVGGGSRIFMADLNTLGGINKLIKDIKSETKHVDVLVNAAAIWHGDNEVFAGCDFDTFSQSVVSDTMMVGLMAPTLLATPSFLSCHQNPKLLISQELLKMAAKAGFHILFPRGELKI